MILLGRGHVHCHDRAERQRVVQTAECEVFEDSGNSRGGRASEPLAAETERNTGITYTESSVVDGWMLSGARSSDESGSSSVSAFWKAL